MFRLISRASSSRPPLLSQPTYHVTKSLFSHTPTPLTRLHASSRLSGSSKLPASFPRGGAGLRTCKRMFRSTGPFRAPVPFIVLRIAQLAVRAVPFVYQLWAKGNKGRVKLLRLFFTLTIGALGTFIVLSLEKDPRTQRRRMMLLDTECEREVTNLTVQNMLKQAGKNILPPTDPAFLKVQEILNEVLETLPEAERKRYPWTLRVVKTPVANAVAIPSGDVFVYTGLLDAVQTEGALAFILSHEISHVLLRHGLEKAGLSIMTGMAEDFVRFSALSFHLVWGALAGVVAGETVKVMNSLMLELPYSRMLETEADMIGLRLMCNAGFHPSEAVEAWIRMGDYQKKLMEKARKQKELKYAKKSDGAEQTDPTTEESSSESHPHTPAKQQDPDEHGLNYYLSTHPPHKDRIRAIQEKMPEVLEDYNRAIAKRLELGLPVRNGADPLFPRSWWQRVIGIFVGG